MLDSAISKNQRIVEREFGIKPELSSYKTYNKKEWEAFLDSKQRKDNVQGVYFPRSLSAHLLEGTELLGTNANHEYFGHGLFCEYSNIGKEMVERDKDLEELEKKILGVDKLPENKKITIEVNNSLEGEYLQKRKKHSEFLNKNILLFEGFAVWMQYFLDKYNNSSEFYNQLDMLDRNTKSAFNYLNEIGKKYGEKTLLQYCGFYQ